MAVLEETLAVLRKAGLSERAAVEAFLTLASYTIGAVGFQAAWQRPPPSDVEEELENPPETDSVFVFDLEDEPDPGEEIDPREPRGPE